MADVLDRIQKLLALATSPNENEARVAALQAATLIRKHGVVLHLPNQEPAPNPEPPTSAPEPFAARAVRSKKLKDRYGHEWQFHELWGGGGHCLFCALPCHRGHAIYAGGDGLLHLRCWASRQEGKVRPGPKPATDSPRPTPSPVRTDNVDVNEAFDDFWAHFESTRK